MDFPANPRVATAHRPAAASEAMKTFVAIDFETASTRREQRLRGRNAKASLRSPQSACQRIEIVSLPAGHDVDVEGCAHGPVGHRREAADQHVGHTMPIEQTDEGLGVERRRIRITHGATPLQTW